MWDCIKQLYKESYKANQVHLDKRLCHMTMSDNEAAILGCNFIDSQQINLFT